MVVRIGDSDFVKAEKISDSITVLKVPAAFDNPAHISFRHLFRYLNSINVRNVMIEAGRGLVSDIVRHGMAHEIVFYVAPKIMGADAVSAFNALHLSSMNDVPELFISDVSRCGPDVRITCRFKERSCLQE